MNGDLLSVFQALLTAASYFRQNERNSVQYFKKRSILLKRINKLILNYYQDFYRMPLDILVYEWIY